MTLKTGITQQDIKNIFGNTYNKKQYLSILFSEKNIHSKIEKQSAEIDAQIIQTWDYDLSKSIIRKMFFLSEKYKNGKKSKKELGKALKEWKKKGYSDFDWPFSAKNFDQYVHSLNRKESLTSARKDRIISDESIKFRRIKEINQFRNDYIEYLIVQNEIVVPTLINAKGVDFYIDGKPFDQKVAGSVGKAFQEQHPDDWRAAAISKPDRLAICLYENQDEERFGNEPRLFVVYLDNDIDSQDIENQLSEIDFQNPYEIQFAYRFESDGSQKIYQTECFVILLHH